MPRSDSSSTVNDQIESRDLFLSRLQLMIVMSKAYLEGHPTGQYRKQAIIENADALFYMSLFSQHSENVSDHRKEKDSGELKHFYEKVRLLSVMGRAFAEDRLSGELKRKELQENIDYICETITFNSRIKDIGFLHVA
ncbi:MAG: hypothetical protein ABIK15_20490 [Pseudomonadota bacterium]|nr:MAG: hypothetical protein C4522_21070 [Desulfobacteraceae bacterium]